MAVYENIIEDVKVSTASGVVTVNVKFVYDEFQQNVSFEVKHGGNPGDYLGNFGGLYIEKGDAWPRGLGPENDHDFPNFEAVAQRFGKWAGDAYHEHGPRFDGLYTSDWSPFYTESPKAPESLEELQNYLKAGVVWHGAPLKFGVLDYSSLPTFGAAVANTLGVLSWDGDQLLLDTLEIVEREDIPVKKYRVRWEIDVTATSPEEAALQVWCDYFSNHHADAFDVIRNGKTVRVDLSDKAEDVESE